MKSDRTYSFVTKALQLIGATGWKTGGVAVPSMVNATNKWVEDWAYTYSSEDANVSLWASYMAEGQGLEYVTAQTTQSSTILPLCLQPSVNAIDRTADFLERYRNWTQDANLTEIIATLNTVDTSRNSSVVIGNLNLTTVSNPYATSFYWGYTSNDTYYRSLGITFVGNWVFFRDDRNLLLPPRDPPANIFTSSSPYIYWSTDPGMLLTRPINESFGFMTPRPAPIMELYLNPKADIAPVVKEVRQYSGYYTFNLKEPLQPNTLYTATLLCGQTLPPDMDDAPVVLLSWQFMTDNSTHTPTDSPTQNPPLTTPPSVIADPAMDLTPKIMMLGTIALIVTLGAVSYFYFKKKS